MPRTEGKKYTIIDIWVAYAQKLLAENPSWTSRYASRVPHHTLLRPSKTSVSGWEEALTYKQFRKTIEHYFDRAKQAIIKGEALNIGSSVGKILAVRVQRDFRKKKQRRVNWGLTRKREPVWNEELQCMVRKPIFHTEDEWCRIAWKKTGQVTNETYYAFKPASANSKRTAGFTLEFTEALTQNPFLKFKYLYIPVKP